jgi:hypothetical protein
MILLLQYYTLYFDYSEILGVHLLKLTEVWVDKQARKIVIGQKQYIL